MPVVAPILAVKIPKGSTWAVSVRKSGQCPGTFTCFAKVDVPRVQPQYWLQSQIFPGPRSLPLLQVGNYEVDVVVVFDPHAPPNDCCEIESTFRFPTGASPQSVVRPINNNASRSDWLVVKIEVV